jgi:hypothetical protein
MKSRVPYLMSAILIAFGISIGAFFDRYKQAWDKSKDIDKLFESTLPRSELEKIMDQIRDEDIYEYQQADKTEKIKRADQILVKLMVQFSKDLELKAPDQNMSILKEFLPRDPK